MSYVKTLLPDVRRIYFVNVPEGCGNSGFMNILMEGAVYRGFDWRRITVRWTRGKKIEHLIVPRAVSGLCHDQQVA